jgi:outer membrane protein assembly factor BamE (lipoprotein component of BamABCDE complex)
MSLLKHVDRIAILSVLTVSLSLPAAALACSVTSHGATRVLTDANFYAIHTGMSAADVLARIGQPHDKMRFPRTATTAWDYHFTDTWSYDSEFSVIFDDHDVVVGKFTERNGQ